MSEPNACPHKSAVMLGHSRVARVPTRYRRWMYTRECLRCGVVPMGPANDSIPRREMRLARILDEICRLWEPGREQADRINAAIDYWSKH